MEERHHKPRPAASQSHIQLRRSPGLKHDKGLGCITVCLRKEAPLKVHSNLVTCAFDRVQVLYVAGSVGVHPLRFYPLMPAAVDAQSAILADPT